MKFAVYQPWIYLHGGIERSLLELVSRSRHEWTVFTGHYEPENTFAGFAQVDVRTVLPTSVDRSIAGVLSSSCQILRQKLPVDPDTDGVVVWCDGIGDLITFRNAKWPLFNICSTPLRAAFDPTYEKLAMSQRGVLGKCAYQLFKHSFKWVDRLAWKKFKGIFSTSTEVRNRIIAGELHDGGEGMVMAYPGVEWSAQVSVEYQPYVLLPGRIMWTKNIEQGIKAFLQADLPAPWRLVVAGFVDRKSQPYVEKLRQLAGNSGRVEFIVSPSDEQLENLYRNAGFCLFPPLNEDWGIVPLESMTHAKAVVANARGGPRESVVHGQTGFLLEPDDASGWVRAIRDLALQEGLMQSMGQAGHTHVQRFTWDMFVKTVDDSLEQWVKEIESAEEMESEMVPTP
ncbi:MAG: group 1 glycosyl transferase [Paucimonas sp.]|jgi:glycosyltransferase involved in cell wall biosynthesis|nr:group 1 glycosyl transferase [Paucimonas sp.]